MSRTIPLTQGQVAIVDDADHQWLSQHRWHVTVHPHTRYAIRHDRSDQPSAKLYMHRAILNPEPGMEVDHINSDGLDNRRCNLRLCRRKQNCANMQKRPNCSSRYKGVTWHRARRKWAAQIGHNYRHYYLGLFDHEEDAARAYDEAAKRFFGEFARLNNPPPIIS